MALIPDGGNQDRVRGHDDVSPFRLELASAGSLMSVCGNWEFECEIVDCARVGMLILYAVYWP